MSSSRRPKARKSAPATGSKLGVWPGSRISPARLFSPPPLERQLSFSFSPGAWSSFHILRLFTEFFQFRLQRHHLARNQTVVRLRANGVNFAIHLLRQKIQ